MSSHPEPRIAEVLSRPPFPVSRAVNYPSAQRRLSDLLLNAAGLPPNLVLTESMEHQALPDLLDDGPDSISSPSNNNNTIGDSGYASASTTPAKAADEPWEESQNCPQPNWQVGFSRSQPRSEGNTKGLEIFDKLPDKAVRDRFRDVLERLQMPLLKQIQKSVKEFHPVAVRLMVLGQTAEDAGPYIVIFCHMTQEKAVRKYCKKSHVRELYQPSDHTIPSFRLHIIARSPKPCASPDAGVYTRQSEVDWTPLTLSGAPIVITNFEGSRAATLGGLIKVTFADDTYLLYGMTAGHMCARDSEPEIESERGSEETSLSEGDLSSSEDECSEEDVDPGLSNLSIADVLQGRQEETIPTSLRPQKHLGTSCTQKESGICDWELIDVAPPVLQPNLIRASYSSLYGGRGELRSVPVDKIVLRRPRNVVLNSGCSHGANDGIRHGSLSALPSSIWLGSAKGMVQTIPLKLDNGLSINDGDSGSWVVDPYTKEVYGHLVASDCFGEGFVVPLPTTLAEIKTTLSAEAVELASGVDVVCKHTMGSEVLPSIEEPGQMLPAKAVETGTGDLPLSIVSFGHDRLMPPRVGKAYYLPRHSPGSSESGSTLNPIGPPQVNPNRSEDSGYQTAYSSRTPTRSSMSSIESMPSRDHIFDLADPSQKGLHATGVTNRLQKHPAVFQSFQCSLCPKRFTRAYNLRSHLRTHSDERQFVCSVCGKAFARTHDCKRHESLHLGEKKYVCGGELESQPLQNWGCGRRFARVDAMRRHFASEAGSVCLKPLFDEEAAEQRDRQMIVPEDVGGRQPTIPLRAVETDDVALQERLLRLPARLVAQYPELLDVELPGLTESSGDTMEWSSAGLTGGNGNKASLFDPQIWVDDSARTGV